MKVSLVRWILAAALLPTALVAAARPAEITMRAVDEPEFDGQIMTYVTGPEGAPPVVLVHGLSQNAAQDWQNVMPALAEAYRVIAVDLPGFGRSTRGNHRYSPDAMARALRTAVRQIEPRPFTLVGHSMGAAISLAYAHQFPGDLDQLVLANLAGVLHHTVTAPLLTRLGGLAYGGMNADEADWMAQLTRALLVEAGRLGVNPAALIATPWLRQVGLRGEPMAISALALVAHDFGPALRDVRTPTHLIWGRDDAITPLRIGEVAAALMPDARLTVLDGVGHMPMFEDAAAFNTALRAALGGPSAPPQRIWPMTTPTRTDTTRCDGEAGRHYRGDLGHLELTDCHNVLIENANLRSLVIRGGSVRVRNSHVHEGLTARNARVELTNGNVIGAPPLTLDNVALDTAGTRFLPLDDAMVRNTGNVPLDLHLSVVSRQGLGDHEQLLHDTVRVRDRW